MPTFLDRLKAFLEQNFPVKAGLWNYSNDNAMASDWLLASPLHVWGLPYEKIKQAVPSETATAGFKLATCSSATELKDNERCYPLQSTVLKPGDAPVSLLVGHSDELVDAVNDLIRSGSVFVDLLTLATPTGRFLAGIRNAITYISHKPAKERPIFRVLYSRGLVGINPKKWNDELSALNFLKAITSGTDPAQPMTIYVGRISSSILSWNHAKVVAADGRRSIVGGHNLWDADYLGPNPVHDVSMRLTGTAAVHAQDYADVLWRFAIKKSAGQYPFWKFADSASYTFDAKQGKCVITDGGLPDVEVYTQAKQRFGSSSSGSAAVIAAGRKAAIDPSDFLPTDVAYFTGIGEPSDRAFVELIDMSQQLVRMCLQKLGASDLYDWPREILMAIGRALGRGVRFQIVLSNPGALPGAPGQVKDTYDGDPPSEVNQALLSTMVDSLELDAADAKRLIREQFKVANFRFSAAETYPEKVAIGLHAKTVMVDDQVFFIGSQNLYLCNLNEFTYIVEDEATARSYLEQYWIPLWQQSQRTVSSDFSAEVEKQELAEAVLFILELQRNRRLYKTWLDTVAERQNLDSDEDRALTEKYLTEIIANAGFDTTPSKVLEALSSPVFTDRDKTTPNDAARSFVRAVNSDPALLQAFAAVIAATDGKSDADADAAINAFLVSKSYQCTSLQVSAAFNELRNEILDHWKGEYECWIKADGGASYADFTPHEDPHEQPDQKRAARAALGGSPSEEPTTVEGPSLTILDNLSFELGEDVITDFAYSGGVLTWIRQGPNRTSGSVTFSAISRPGLKDPYVGLEFFGTLTYPDDATGPYKGTYSYYGRFGHGLEDGDDPPKAPFSWPFWILIGLGSLLALGALGFAIQRTLRDRARRDERARRDRYGDGGSDGRGRYTSVSQSETMDEMAQRSSIPEEEVESVRRRFSKLSLEERQRLNNVTDLRSNSGLGVSELRKRKGFRDQEEVLTERVRTASGDLPLDFLREQLDQKISTDVQNEIDRRSSPTTSYLDFADVSSLSDSLSGNRDRVRTTVTDFGMSSIELSEIDPLTKRAVVGSGFAEPMTRKIRGGGATSYLRDSVRSAITKLKTHFLSQNITDLQKRAANASTAVEKTKGAIEDRRQQLQRAEDRLADNPNDPQARQDQQRLNKEIGDLIETQREQEREAEKATQDAQERQRERDKNSDAEKDAERRVNESAKTVFEK